MSAKQSTSFKDTIYNIFNSASSGNTIRLIESRNKKKCLIGVINDNTLIDMYNINCSEFKAYHKTVMNHVDTVPDPKLPIPSKNGYNPVNAWSHMYYDFMVTR